MAPVYLAHFFGTGEEENRHKFADSHIGWMISEPNPAYGFHAMM